MSSPKGSLTALTKLSSLCRARPLRVLVLGTSQVGKSALVVRYLTRRFIGEYAPRLDRVYQHTAEVSSTSVSLEILDSAGDEKDTERHEANIRWADVFLLIYSVTDRCSFDDCSRAKFLINYNKRKRRITAPASKDPREDAPVLLVGNKKDLVEDRMVTTEEGRRRCRDIGCRAFHEISVRESIEEVQEVFEDAVRFLRDESKVPRLRRAASEVHGNTSRRSSSSNSGGSIFSGGPEGSSEGPPSQRSLLQPSTSSHGEFALPDSLLDALAHFRFRKSSREEERLLPRRMLSPDFYEGSSAITPLDMPSVPFRGRACTDGLLHKGKFLKRTMDRSQRGAGFRERNLSIAMKGESC